MRLKRDIFPAIIFSERNERSFGYEYKNNVKSRNGKAA